MAATDAVFGIAIFQTTSREDACLVEYNFEQVRKMCSLNQKTYFHRECSHEAILFK